ncbi:unnamed protein product [Cercopithifilaria johnstoni]|uniref:Secreted protein n=1 Tax=Cercopithifilaria johnstoni TaxID=2874296 RepID=A0A8J2MBW4_9BILA|nr:unnamed protein product [Cercopithifilaria johnstoni]
MNFRKSFGLGTTVTTTVLLRMVCYWSCPERKASTACNGGNASPSEKFKYSTTSVVVTVEKGAACSPAHPTHQYTDRRTDMHAHIWIDIGKAAGRSIHEERINGPHTARWMYALLLSLSPSPRPTVPPKEPIGSIGLSPPLNGGIHSPANSLILCVRRGGTVRRGCFFEIIL